MSNPYKLCAVCLPKGVGGSRGCPTRYVETSCVERNAWSEGYAARNAEIVADLRLLASRMHPTPNPIIPIEHELRAAAHRYERLDDRLEYSARADVKETKK